MSWWRTVRSRPELTQAELTFFSWRTLVFLLVITCAVVVWSKLGASPSGFHMKGKVTDQNGNPLEGILVGYSYAWKGHMVQFSRGEVNTNKRKFPRIFENVVTNQIGRFIINIDKDSIEYVTILGFWKDKNSFTNSVRFNKRKIEVEVLPNRGNLVPWDEGVVRHYEPGWRMIDAIFGWGSGEVEMFAMETSKGNNNANK